VATLDPIGQMAADAVSQELPNLLEVIQGGGTGSVPRTSRPREAIPQRASVTGAYYLDGRATQQRDRAVRSTPRPKVGLSQVPRMLPAKAEGSHSQPCRLPEAMPLKYAPMLQPKATRAP
jgi:hypothetical protein